MSFRPDNFTIFNIQRVCKKCKERKPTRGGSTRPTGFVCAECRVPPAGKKAA